LKSFSTKYLLRDPISYFSSILDIGRARHYHSPSWRLDKRFGTMTRAQQSLDPSMTRCRAWVGVTFSASASYSLHLAPISIVGEKGCHLVGRLGRPQWLNPMRGSNALFTYWCVIMAILPAVENLSSLCLHRVRPLVEQKY
jgi:hypothetical protein